MFFVKLLFIVSEKGKRFMDRIKRFITCLVPVFACNFKCEYCYLDSHKGSKTRGIRPLVMEPVEIANSLSVERLGGKYYFNLCAAGETMLYPQLIELVSALTKAGYYIDIVTNGVINKRFDELISTLSSDQKKHLFIKFSFHYLELIKRKQMDDFLKSIEAVKSSAISYSIEITPCDYLIPYIDKIKEFSIEKFGALPHITIARNESVKEISILSKYNRDEYQTIWSQFNSTLFNFKLSIFNQKRCEFCYAGDWSLAVNLAAGYYSQCYVANCLGKIKDLDKDINFRAIGKCREPHCFNGHACLALGCIPEINSPLYADERNRVMENGHEWLRPEIKSFLVQNLSSKINHMMRSQRRKRIVRTKWLRLLNQLSN